MVLLARYGAAAADLLKAEGPAPRMLADSDHSLPELEQLIRTEQIVHLPDLVMRRTALAVTGRLSERDLILIAQLCADVLGWDAVRQAAELQETQTMLRTRHRLRQDPAPSV